jgi:hypothetical protein
MIPTILAFGGLSLAMSASGVMFVARSPGRNQGLALLALFSLSASATLLTVHASRSARDLGSYLRELERFTIEGFGALRDTSLEPVIGLYMYAASRFANVEAVFYALIALSSLFLIHRAVSICASLIMAPAILSSYLLTGFFTAYTSNALRQGMAVALVYLAVAYASRDGFRRTSKLLLLLATLTHYASIAAILVAIIVLWVNPRVSTLLRVWLISLGLFLSWSSPLRADS